MVNISLQEISKRFKYNCPEWNVYRVDATGSTPKFCSFAKHVFFVYKQSVLIV